MGDGLVYATRAKWDNDFAGESVGSYLTASD